MNPHPTSTLPVCSCGHDRHHPLVSAEAEYALLGYILMVIGISARPRRIKYRCRRCDQVFDATTDPVALDKHD